MCHLLIKTRELLLISNKLICKFDAFVLWWFLLLPPCRIDVFGEGGDRAYESCFDTVLVKTLNVLQPSLLIWLSRIDINLYSPRRYRTTYRIGWWEWAMIDKVVHLKSPRIFFGYEIAFWRHHLVWAEAVLFAAIDYQIVDRKKLLIHKLIILCLLLLLKLNFESIRLLRMNSRSHTFLNVRF